ncbi:hypothetical protein LZ023_38490 (plasmid) [Pseudomonas silvicola]|nr:hypothetical protein LZ023_38490 [Pseudomonas silvicola]
MTYEDLYRRIAMIVFSCGPQGARELIVKAELFADDEGGEYQFDYLDETAASWFEPDAQAIGDLTGSIERFPTHYFVEHDMTEGRSSVELVEHGD